MSRFTEEQLKAMGLEEYEPGKYRKKVQLPKDYVFFDKIGIKKQDGTVEPIVYKDPSGGVPIDEQEGYDHLEEWLGMFPADDKPESKTPMLNQALERGQEKAPEMFDGSKYKFFHTDELAMMGNTRMIHPDIESLFKATKGTDMERVINIFKNILDSRNIQNSINEFRRILKIDINNFSEHIVISNKARVKPYIKGKKTPKLPQKYMGPTYGWDEKNQLIDLATGDLVPSNPTKAGKPRLWRPNGQDIYSDYIQRDARNNYIKKLKEYLMPYFTERERIDDTRLRIELNFFIVENARYKLIDNDNRWIWEKAVGDVMKQTLIPDDNPRIVFSNLKNTYFVPREEDMKMEVIIWAKN